MAVYVFDSAPLSCFARARQLLMLDRLTAGNERVTTRAVIEEVKNGVAAFPDLQEVLDLAWLRVESSDSLDELRHFAKYAARLGSGLHDIGEASVLAWAEAHGAIAFTDDEAAVQAGRDEGVVVCRTLAVVARGIKHGQLSHPEADRSSMISSAAADASPSEPGSSFSGRVSRGYSRLSSSGVCDAGEEPPATVPSPGPVTMVEAFLDASAP